jgi:hypothetical protein
VPAATTPWPPQVLHERHETRVTAEVLGHRDDARRPAGHHAERGGRPVQVGGAREQDPRAEAHEEGRTAHERHRQPVAAEDRERRGADVGAERHAGDRLRHDERPAADGQTSGPDERGDQPDEQGREQIRRRQMGGVQRQAQHDRRDRQQRPRRRCDGRSPPGHAQVLWHRCIARRHRSSIDVTP